jgi:ribosomal protein S18 acetylase RimI-like enzyme
MNHKIDILIREASPDDARVLAELMNVAGEGIPAWLWSRMAGPGVDVMVFGAQRVGRTEGSFSFRNAHVAVVEGVIAGMLLGYRLPDPYETGALEEYPEVVRPLIGLESLAAGSWYINAVATAVPFRGRGVGTQLMERAQDLAERAGANELSLIVAAQNTVAKELYERLGYETAAARPGVLGFPHSGDWILMKKAIGQGDARGRL